MFSSVSPSTLQVSNRAARPHGGVTWNHERRRLGSSEVAEIPCRSGISSGQRSLCVSLLKKREVEQTDGRNQRRMCYSHFLITVYMWLWTCSVKPWTLIYGFFVAAAATDICVNGADSQNDKSYLTAKKKWLIWIDATPLIVKTISTERNKMDSLSKHENSLLKHPAFLQWTNFSSCENTHCLILIPSNSFPTL